MYKLLQLVTLILSVAFTFHAHAFTSTTSNGCVKRIIPLSGRPTGIATANVEQALLIQLCNDSYAIALFKHNKLKLAKAKLQVIPSRALSNNEQNNGLPDGEVSSSKQFKAAWLTGPTRRYLHGILGDSIEASGIAAIDQNGRRYDFTLDDDSVFEDLRVRLADLDSDGNEELIVVHSYQDAGAALAIFGVRNNKLVKVTETPAIGLSYRWLNPAVVGDLDGDGQMEIAYVETPHIGGILHVLSLKGNKLIEKVQLRGVSNHAIGSRILDMAAIIDWNQDGISDIAIPNANRTAINIYSFKGGNVSSFAEIETQGRISSSLYAADLDANMRAELYYINEKNLLVSLMP